MALGKPPVSGVRATDPRAINGAIDNIRRRLEAIEAALGQTELVAQVAANQSTLQVSNLAAQISSLDQRVTAIENTIDLDIGSYTAGESILAGQGVVGISSNTVGVADPSDPTRMFGLIGVAIDNGSVGSAVRVQRRGVYTVQGSPAFVTGRAVYLGDLGLTQTPDYEATALPIGVAVSASQVFVLPDWPAILYPAFSSGFADEYQRYLPVTYLAAQGMADLEAQLNALPFSSGVDAHALVPVTLGGVAMLVYAGDIAALGGGSGGQTSIQFKNEGVDQGGLGTISAVDFVGAGVSASAVGPLLTVTIPGGGSGGGSIDDTLAIEVLM